MTSALAVSGADQCQSCRRASGDGVGCQFCGQVHGLPAGVALSSPGRRLGENLLEAVLLFVTLFVGWIVWCLIILGRGQTPAKQLLGMRVIDLKRGTHLSWGTMFLREVIVKPIFTFVASIVFYLPLLWILWDKSNQELWDKAMGTIVVNDPAGALASGSFEIRRQRSPLAAIAAFSGPTKPCPDCAESIHADAKICKHCGFRFRTCPDCAEPIAAAAKVCRHCGFRFGEEQVAATT